MAKIWKEKAEPKYYIRLFQKDNEVQLRIVDEEGVPVPCGRFATITEEGTLFVDIHVDVELAKEVGIKLDENGSITMYEQ